MLDPDETLLDRKRSLVAWIKERRSALLNYGISPFNLKFIDPVIESKFLEYDFKFSIWHARVSLFGALFFSIIALLLLLGLGSFPEYFLITIFNVGVTIFFFTLLALSFTKVVNAENIDSWVSFVLVSIFLGAIVAAFLINNSPGVMLFDEKENVGMMIIFPCFVAGIIYINTISVVRFSRTIFINIAYHLSFGAFNFILLGETFFSWPLSIQIVFLMFISIPSLFISFSRELVSRNQYIASKNLDIARKESEKAKNEASQLLGLFTNLNITTDTPNRTQLQSQLAFYFGNEKSDFALILLKLSRFKEINNTLGHERCDKLLKLLTLKIDSALNISEFEVLPIGSNLQKLPSHIAVIEGITFGVIVKDFDEKAINNFATYMRDSSSGTIDLEGILLDLQMVVGVSTVSSLDLETKTPQTLIHEAQVGLSIGSSQENRIGVYSSSRDSYSESKLSLMGKLRTAINENKLELYYQPKVSFQKRKILGVEALLRWKGEDGSFYSPEDFISHAESTGVIKDLTRWVISSAFESVSEIKRIFPETTVSINLSTLNLREDDFVDFVLSKVVEYEVEASDIVFEITENHMLKNAESAINKLSALKSCGFKISIDDYGTGYSSLSYLKRIPIDEVKIDRAFITDINKIEEDKKIVEATINMCHNLGYSVVAEGVEDEATLDLLVELSCDLIQGYFFTKPIPVNLLPDFNEELMKKYKI